MKDYTGDIEPDVTSDAELGETSTDAPAPADPDRPVADLTSADTDTPTNEVE